MTVNNSTAKSPVTLSKHHYVNLGRIKALVDPAPIYDSRGGRRGEGEELEMLDV